MTKQAGLAERLSLTLKREYPVAAEKVWRAWTDPQAMVRWFKPDGFSVPLAEADVRVAGRFHIVMVDPGGKEYDLSGAYREVVANRKLVMTWSWKDQPGEQSVLTITLRPTDKGTELELRHEGFLDRGESVPTHHEGWDGALAQLGAMVSGKPLLSLRRHFPVPPQKVWAAWTDAERLKKWWSPSNEPVSLAELDVRAGGRFRLIFGGADGRANEAQGVYREVVPQRRLVFTWCWPNSTPERVSLVTIALRRMPDGGTELDFRHEQLFDEATRDRHLGGWNALFAALERFFSANPNH